MRLQGKTLVVIGGSAGIGLAASFALQTEGASLVVVGPDEASCEAARGQLANGAELLVADARDPRTGTRAVQRAVECFGRCDGLYHVAGGSGRSRGDGALHELSDEGIEYTLRQNLMSVLFSNRAVVRHFLGRRQPGVVLNLASVLADRPSPVHFGTVTYAAAKAGILGLTRSAAAMYAEHNIRFNALAPGLVDTPAAARALNDPHIARYVREKQPLDGGRPARTEDLNEAAIYLLSDASRFVTGQVLRVDGGWSVCEAAERSSENPRQS